MSSNLLFILGIGLGNFVGQFVSCFLGARRDERKLNWITTLEQCLGIAVVAMALTWLALRITGVSF